MKLSPEDIEQIMELSACFFTRDEIAKIMGFDTVVFCQKETKEDPIGDLIEGGRLKAEAEIRKSIFDLAKSGSEPAQVLAAGIIKDFHLRNITV